MKNQGIKIGHEKIDRLNLVPLIIMLYSNKLIEEELYTDMISVNSIRRKFIHYNMSGNITKDDANKIEQNLIKIRTSLEELQKIDKSMNPGPIEDDDSSLLNE